MPHRLSPVRRLSGPARAGDGTRRDAVEAFKKAQKEGMPEDESKDGEAQAQKLLEKFTKTLDEALQKKEKEIMTV